MSINVTRSSMPPFEEYCDEIRGLWDSRWLTNMGCKHRQLEEDLQRYLQCGQITLFTNGHLALENILQAFRLEGEIITTPFTFASTTHAIVRCGCKPVFCDIDPVTYTLDPGKLEALITERTAAILPVHVYGNLCDTDRIGEIGRASASFETGSVRPASAMRQCSAFTRPRSFIPSRAVRSAATARKSAAASAT